MDYFSISARRGDCVARSLSTLLLDWYEALNACGFIHGFTLLGICAR